MIDSVLIGIDISPNGKDIPVLTVGRKRPRKSVEIINIITGDEAMALYNRLVRPKRIPEIDK